MKPANILLYLLYIIHYLRLISVYASNYGP